jgi:lipooligosaccharide transport system permease protein
MILQPALHVVEYNVYVFRKSVRSALFVSLLQPLLYLSAMGLGLGGLVRSGHGTIDGVSYLHFLVPGMLATTAMQTAAVETTYPIMARLQWQRYYEAMLNTPLRVRDLLEGEMLWLLLRVGATVALFFVVAALFGAVTSATALLAIPVALLTGLAFGTPIFAFTATQRNDAGFNAINRFIVVPLFLLGGAFFPITQLPRVFQGIAWCTPLTHGVALCRDLLLGRTGMPSALAHLAVLLAYTSAGLAVAMVTYRRRLSV